MESNKGKIISSMKMIYFLAFNSMPLSSFPNLLQFGRFMDMPSIGAIDEYGTYSNAVSGREFLLAIASVLEDKLIEEVTTSPYFSIMVDESTDRALESHLITYVTYLANEGIGQSKTEFLNLSGIPNGTASSIFEAWKKTKIKYDLDQTHLVGLATDGATSMVGVHEGFATKLKREVLHLFRTHCIAHREALASKDAVEAISPMASLEKLSNRIHGWIGKSFLRNEALQSLLTIMEIGRLKVLHIHNVWWLSMGQVMERMASIMPAILSVFGGPGGCGELYHEFRCFSILFFIHLLADVLGELNTLNKIFQKENLDLTEIGEAIEITTRSLSRKFLVDEKEEFGADTKFVAHFLDISRSDQIHFQDSTGAVHSHILHYAPLPHAVDFGGDGTLQGCKVIAQAYVRKVMESLQEQFLDLKVFNVAKLFSPISFPPNLAVLHRNGFLWLQIFVEHFCTNGGNFLDERGLKSELRGFLDTLQISCGGLKMHQAWMVYSSNLDYVGRYLHMTKLWQTVLVIPASTASCERGFSTQNHIKSTLRCSLVLETLEAQMRVAMAKVPIEAIDFEEVWIKWCAMKSRRL